MFLAFKIIVIFFCIAGAVGLMFFVQVPKRRKFNYRVGGVLPP